MSTSFCFSFLRIIFTSTTRHRMSYWAFKLGYIYKSLSVSYLRLKMPNRLNSYNQTYFMILIWSDIYPYSKERNQEAGTFILPRTVSTKWSIASEQLERRFQNRNFYQCKYKKRNRSSTRTFECSFPFGTSVWDWLFFTLSSPPFLFLDFPFGSSFLILCLASAPFSWALVLTLPVLSSDLAFFAACHDIHVTKLYKHWLRYNSTNSIK